MTLEPDIESHYRLALERGRLREGGGAVEFVRTRELLDRFLPRPPAIILDVGGGAGAYAVPLAAEGHQVHLLDPVSLHVEQAPTAARSAETALAGAAVGDARRLPYADASADAALLLGPLYHLTERADRVTALQEAHRALRPGGVVAAAAISRFASTFDGLARGLLIDPRFQEIVERDVRDGQHRNPEPDDRPEWFTTAYFHRPEELAHELEEAGFGVEAVLAVEGPAAFRPDLDAWLTERDRHDAMLRAIRRVEAEPSPLGASAHLLAVGRVSACPTELAETNAAPSPTPRNSPAAAASAFDGNQRPKSAPSMRRRLSNGRQPAAQTPSAAPRAARGRPALATTPAARRAP